MDKVLNHLHKLFYRLELAGVSSFLILVLLSYIISYFLFKKENMKQKIFLKYLTIYHLLSAIGIYRLVFYILHKC